MSPVFIIARKEITDGLRNRWVAGATLLLASLAFALAFIGSSPTGQLDVSPLAVVVVSLSSLTIFLIPLIALLISYDAIVGEGERGTLLLLLTYPVNKGQVVLGKFLGHCAILAIATTLGYGVAGLAVAGVSHVDRQGWQAFGMLIASSIVLGASFIAIAYWISASVRERGTAAGIAIGVWFGLVVIFDLVLLGALIISHGLLGEDLFPYLLLLNPADIYRLLNLTAFENVRSFSGMAGLSAQVHFHPTTLAAVLVLWVVLPLALAWRIFSRREV